jgi:hypothetical protein
MSTARNQILLSKYNSQIKGTRLLGKLIDTSARARKLKDKHGVSCSTKPLSGSPQHPNLETFEHPNK